MIYHLSPEQIERAKTVARRRDQWYRANGKRKYGQGNDRGDADNFLGAAGELAAAMVTGANWVAEHVEGGPDLITKTGATVEVRTAPKESHSLILHPSDQCSIAILVLGKVPRMWVYGWCRIADFRIPAYWRTPEKHGVRHEAFFVPQRVLTPMEETINRKEMTA
jgi:hypothetical protein